MLQSNKKKRELTVDNAELFPFLVSLMEQGHTVTLKLKGVSMRPFLEDERDVALMRLATEVVEGEPVLAEVGKGHFVLHRVLKVEGEEVTLLGDGNLATEHCTKGDVKAQVIGFYRKGRQTLDRVDGRKWRAYSCVWMRLRPVRRYLLAIYRRWIRLFGPI
ncbi:MAG: S24/S26 family peptidase [Prevotella sp.]|nr:S24/S26 family peptidase [Prevotella sp.]MCD8305541.1 S24/S26 family peptidase [Prevotella sp.]